MMKLSTLYHHHSHYVENRVDRGGASTFPAVATVVTVVVAVVAATVSLVIFLRNVTF